MPGKIISPTVLCVVLLSVILPVNLAVIQAPGSGKVLVTLDTCHMSSPFQPASSGKPFYHEQICGCLPVPEFTGFYTAWQPTFKPLLLVSDKDRPPRV